MVTAEVALPRGVYPDDAAVPTQRWLPQRYYMTQLSRNQRFEDAQRWFHYVFDPTDTSPAPAHSLPPLRAAPERSSVL